MQVPNVGTFDLQVPEGGVPLVGTTLILGDATGLREVTVPGQVSGADLDLAGGEVEHPIQKTLTPKADEGIFLEDTFLFRFEGHLLVVPLRFIHRGPYYNSCRYLVWVPSSCRPLKEEYL